jgi:tetratricopeptide (TPR) repeat protein
MFELGDIDRAIDHFKRALRGNPDHGNSQTTLKKVKGLAKAKEEGKDAWNAGRYAEAVDKYSEALAVAPENDAINSKLFYNRALARTQVPPPHTHTPPPPRHHISHLPLFFMLNILSSFPLLLLLLPIPSIFLLLDSFLHVAASSIRILTPCLLFKPRGVACTLTRVPPCRRLNSLLSNSSSVT